MQPGCLPRKPISLSVGAGRIATMNDFQSDRRALLLAGGGLLLTGCQGLDFSAAGEGAGVQIIGAVVVLARYRATAQQRAVAEKRTRELVAAAVRPAYQNRRVAIEEESKKKIAAIEREYAAHSPPPGSSVPLTTGVSNGDSPPNSGSAYAIQQRRKQEEIARVKAEATARTASLNSVMQSIGGAPDQTPPPVVGPNVAHLASTRDRETLIAALTSQVPRFVAVPVPAQGIEAEKSGKALVVVMDTRTQNPASENVLVLDRVPPVGKDVKLDGVTARIAGN